MFADLSLHPLGTKAKGASVHMLMNQKSLTEKRHGPICDSFFGHFCTLKIAGLNQCGLLYQGIANGSTTLNLIYLITF